MCKDGHVYNLEVADTHTYIANGVVVHNCHHAAADSWKRVLTHFGVMDRRLPALGVTATMSREDGRALGDIWDEVVFRWSILDGIRSGHLADIRGIQVTVDGLDLSEVARRQGDYADGSLGEALESSGAGQVVAKSYVEHASDRSGIMFSPTVRDRKSTRLNSSHRPLSRMPSSA